MMVIRIDADGGLDPRNGLFLSSIRSVLTDAGVPINSGDIQSLQMRTKTGTLAYMLEAGQHVFKWVDNHERLTGELKAVHPVVIGAGYSIHTSRAPAVSILPPGFTDFEESEL